VTPGRVQLITCTIKHKMRGKQRIRAKKCSTRLVADTVALKGSPKAKVRRAALLKGRHSYPAKTVIRKHRIRILTTSVLPAKRYRLVVGRQVLHVKIR